MHRILAGAVFALFAARAGLPAALTGSLPGAAQAGDAPSLADRVERQLVAAAAKAGPAVVAIEVVVGTPSLTDDASKPAQGGGGSGVLISADGLILTNFHVAGKATSIEIGLADGRKLSAARLGTDPVGDVCLLKVESPTPLACAELGDSDALRVGQWAFAMGNPFNTAQTTFQPTITFGIIGGLHRYNAMGEFLYGDSIQTDAAINPGNSGGPLFDIQGRLVGINGKGNMRRGRVHSGIGYAIPINQIKNRLEDLKAGKTLVHGYAGFSAEDEAGLQGPRVKTVPPGSPADAAGFKTGDLILSADGSSFRESVDLANFLSKRLAGETVPFEILRDGIKQKLELKLGTPPQKKRQGPEPGKERNE